MYKEGIAATVIFLAAYVLIAVMVIWSIPLAFGTAIEDKQPTWQEQLRDRAAEWNIMTAINQTLSLSDDYCSPDDIYCVINGGVYYCKEDMSICDQAKGWLNLTSKDHKFPTEIKNVEWCTSSDYAICKIDGYLVDCEEHVDMCLAASKLLSVEQKQIIENNYVDENGTRLCLGKFCREMVKEFASESAYLKGDYCSSSEAWLNVTHVEYCIVGGKGIQCSEPDEQKICQEHDRRLEKLGQ